MICIISLQMLETHGPGCCTAQACSYLFLGQANISELPKLQKLQDADGAGVGGKGRPARWWRLGGEGVGRGGAN